MATTDIRVSPRVETSPIYKIRGQRSRWHYPHDKLTPEHTIRSKNVNLSERGNTETRYGYQDWNQVAGDLANSEPVVGLIYKEGWSEADDPARVGTLVGSGASETAHVICTPDKVYYDRGLIVTGYATRTNITGALTLTGDIEDRVRWTLAQNHLVCTNGVDALFIHNMDFSGTPDNCETLTTSPTSIATCLDLITHKNVLMAFAPTIGSTFYPTRVMWCDVNRKTFILDIASFQDVNRFEIYEGGSPIVGAVDNFGFAMVFKEDGLYPSTLVYDTGYIEMRIAEESIRKGFSPIARHSLIARPEFCFGVAREGAFIVTPDLNVQIVTGNIQESWDALNPSRLQYAVAWFREKDHQVRCLLSKDSTTGHDQCLVWDWDSGEVWFDEYTDAMNYGTSVRSDAGLGFPAPEVEYDWLGGTTGGLWQGNVSGVNEDDGISFPWEIQMAPNDLGLQGRQKTILNIRTIYRARSGQGDMTLIAELDQGRKRSRTKNISLSSQQERWDGGSTWDSGLRYDTGLNAEDYFFVNRQAKTIAPIFMGNTPASLIGYQCEYIPEE